MLCRCGGGPRIKSGMQGRKLGLNNGTHLAADAAIVVTGALAQGRINLRANPADIQIDGIVFAFGHGGMA